MATLSFNNIRGYNAGWTISGLQNPFNTNYYLEVGLALETVVAGSSSISKIATVLAPSSGTSTSVSYNHCKYVIPNHYHTFYGYAKALNGLYYPIVGGGFTSESPSWKWTYKGTDNYGQLIPTTYTDFKMSRDEYDTPGFAVTAADWNDMAEWVYLLGVMLNVSGVTMLTTQYTGYCMYDYDLEDALNNIRKLMGVCKNITSVDLLVFNTIKPSYPINGKEISYWQYDSLARFLNQCYDYYINI